MLLSNFVHAKEAYISVITAMEVTNVCTIGETKIDYADLGDALTAVKNNQTIKLLQTVNYDKTIKIDNKSITFDLNGFNLNLESSGTALIVVGVGSEVKLTGKGEFNASCNDDGGTGVAAENGGKATVTNATGGYQGVYAGNNATVTVHGNVTSTSAFFLALGMGSGVRAQKNSTVTVHGNVISIGNYGIEADNNVAVAVYGDVTGGHYGVKADNNATVTVYGDITGNAWGVYALNGSVVKVSGIASGSTYGIEALGSSNVTVTGGVVSELNGIGAKSGSKVSVSGGATGNQFGVIAEGNATVVTVYGDVSGLVAIGSNVTVAGDVIGNFNGVDAQSNAAVTVSGSVTSVTSVGVIAITGSTVSISRSVIGGSSGIVADNATVMIGGDVMSANPESSGVRINSHSSRAEVTIDGQVKVLNECIAEYFIQTAPDSYYIAFLKRADNLPSSTKSGYLEYAVGTNYVWVKDNGTGTDIIAQPTSALKAFVKKRTFTCQRSDRRRLVYCIQPFWHGCPSKHGNG